jgi:hypothetical protein
MNKQERLFYAYAYFMAAVVGSLLLSFIFFVLFKDTLVLPFQVKITQLIFGVLAIAGYLCIIYYTAQHFAYLRQLRATINRKLYPWRHRPECNFSASLGWEFAYTMRYAMIGRFIPFLLLAYMILSFLEAWAGSSGKAMQ